MRSLKFALAALAATVMLGTTRAEPVKIRTSWVAPVSNWASIVLEKKDLAKHMGKSYTLEAVRFAGTPSSVRRPAPLIGEHNAEVLAEVGFSDDEIAALVDSGVLHARNSLDN